MSSVTEETKERLMKIHGHSNPEPVIFIGMEPPDELLEGCEEEWEDVEDHDDRGHVAHEFRHEQYPKAKRKKNRRIGKLAKKARRK
jgi:hypothetical protein